MVEALYKKQFFDSQNAQKCDIFIVQINKNQQIY